MDECIGAVDACGVCNGAGDIYECGCADIDDCGATKPKKTLWAFAAVIAATTMRMASAMMLMTAWVYSTCGVCNGAETSTSGCSDIPEGDCDCDGNQKMLWAFAVAIALKTSMRMASATTWMTASVRSTRAALQWSR